MTTRFMLQPLTGLKNWHRILRRENIQHKVTVIDKEGHRKTQYQGRI